MTEAGKKSGMREGTMMDLSMDDDDDDKLRRVWMKEYDKQGV